MVLHRERPVVPDGTDYYSSRRIAVQIGRDSSAPIAAAPSDGVASTIASFHDAQCSPRLAVGPERLSPCASDLRGARVLPGVSLLEVSSLLHVDASVAGRTSAARGEVPARPKFLSLLNFSLLLFGLCAMRPCMRPFRACCFAGKPGQIEARRRKVPRSRGYADQRVPGVNTRRP